MEEAHEVADHIKRMGCDSIAIEADMSKENDCIKLIERANKYFGRIDVLVNNAGIQQDVPFEDTTTEEWYKIIGVDLTGPFVCSREAVKHMEKHQQKMYESFPFKIKGVLFSSILYVANKYMIKIADIIGEDTQEIKEWISRTEANFYKYFHPDISQKLGNTEELLFYNYDLVIKDRIRKQTISSLVPI